MSDPKPPRADCRNCKYWSYDMDMEPFCTHANASPIGTNINVMRGLKQTSNMRGEPCGPQGKFFEPTQVRPIV